MFDPFNYIYLIAENIEVILIIGCLIFSISSSSNLNKRAIKKGLNSNWIKCFFILFIGELIVLFLWWGGINYNTYLGSLWDTYMNPNLIFSNPQFSAQIYWIMWIVIGLISLVHHLITFSILGSFFWKTNILNGLKGTLFLIISEHVGFIFIAAFYFIATNPQIIFNLSN